MAPGRRNIIKLLVVYVPIARLIIRIRSRAHGRTYTHLDNFIGEKAPRRAGPGQAAPGCAARHRRGFSFSGFGHAMPFFSIPGTRLSPARGAPRRIARTLHRSVRSSFCCPHVQARLLVESSSSRVVSFPPDRSESQGRFL